MERVYFKRIGGTKMKKLYLETPEAVIKALKEGKVIKDDNGYSYKLVDGFIVSTYKNHFIVGDNIFNIDNHPYILEEEPLKIEVGKFYKTKNGRKAWVVSRQQDEHYPYIIAILDEVDAYAVTKDGRFYDDRSYSFDLVGQWDGDN